MTPTARPEHLPATARIFGRLVFALATGLAAALGAWSGFAQGPPEARAVVGIRPQPGEDLEALRVGLKGYLLDRVGPATFPAETNSTLTVGLNSPDVGGLAAAVAECLDELNAENVVGRRERVRHLVESLDDLDRQIRHAERSVRRIGEIAVVALAPTAEPIPPTVADPEPTPMPPQPPEPERIEQALHRDEQLRPLIERRNAARERLKRTEERVLPGSPILAREIAEFAEIERSVTEALAHVQPDNVAGIPRQPAPRITAPVPSSPPAEPNDGRAAFAAELAALSAAEARGLHALRDLRDAANRDLLELERKPTEPRYWFAGSHLIDSGPERRREVSVLAGLCGFLGALVLPFPYGRGWGSRQEQIH